MTKGFQCDRCRQWFYLAPVSTYNFSESKWSLSNAMTVQKATFEFCGGCHQNILDLILNETKGQGN